MYINTIFKGEKCRPLGITLFAWYKTCFPQQKDIPLQTFNHIQCKLLDAPFIFASRFSTVDSDSSFIFCPPPSHLCPPSICDLGFKNGHIGKYIKLRSFHHTTTHQVLNGSVQQPALMVFFLQTQHYLLCGNRRSPYCL